MADYTQSDLEVLAEKVFVAAQARPEEARVHPEDAFDLAEAFLRFRERERNECLARRAVAAPDLD